MNLNDLLKSLQKEYLNDLPARIEGMKGHLIQMDARALMEDFHKLKGTGQTYGIPEISELGLKMEVLLNKFPEEGLKHAPAALDVLTEIHQARIKGEIFNLSQDQRFQSIN